MYEFDDTVAIDGIERLDPGTNVLVDGPPMVGTEELLLRLLAAGRERDQGALIVTTDDSARTIVDAYRDVAGDVDPDRLYVVDCWSGGSGASDSPDVTVETVALERLTDVGRGVMTGLSELRPRGIEHVRLGYLSLTTLLTVVSSEEAFKFVRILTSSLEDRGCLGLFAMDGTVHDDRTVNMLRRPFDGVIEVRESRTGEREYRSRGLAGASTDWVPF